MRVTNKVTFMSIPGCILGLKKILGDVVTPTMAEDGCIHYDMFHDQENPIKFFLLETWSSEEAYAAHLKTEHYLTFQKEYLNFAEGQYIMELELLGR